MSLSDGGFKLQVTGLTNQGLERPRNEDNFFVRANDHCALLVVADGMGGHRAGEVASALAVEEAEAAFGELEKIKPATVAKARSLVKSLFEQANDKIFATAEKDPGCHGMGTTLTAALLCGQRLTVGHVGDSRAYKIHGDSIYLLTKDHSLVETYVEAGELSPEEAENHPQRHVLTRALGVSGHIKIDFAEQEVEPGSVLLLCTDGLTNMVQADEILACYNKNPDPGPFAEALVALANARGGRDNITVVIAAGIGG